MGEKIKTDFNCSYVEVLKLRCNNPIKRENFGDFFDYPHCEKCQKLDRNRVTRLDDGSNSQLL